jgi:glycosyltransferase involved in cell wall biosynthesis
MARIVHVLGDGRPGGGTTVAFDLCRLLAAEGEAVTVVTQRGSRLVGDAAACGLPAVGIDFSRRLRTPLAALEIGRVLRHIGPAVVHAHGARAGLPVALLPHSLVGRFVYTVHGFHYRVKPPPIRRLARLAEAFCIGRADCTVFVSDADLAHAEAAQLLQRSRDQQVIKNAVSVEGVSPGANRKVYDIGFLGRLHPQKNPLILADILAAMRPALPSLCVIGDGALRSKLESRIDRAGLSAQVAFCGECDRATALRFLASCRTLVLPSLWEGHALALIEAMQLGLPAVASDVAGNDEIVVDGQTGYLVPATDAGAYADRLKRLLNEAGLRSRMGCEAQRRAARDYSPERMLRAYKQVYSASAAEDRRLARGAPI